MSEKTHPFEKARVAQAMSEATQEFPSTIERDCWLSIGAAHLLIDALERRGYVIVWKGKQEPQ